MSLADTVYGIKELDESYEQYRLAEQMFDGTAKEYFVSVDVERALRVSGATSRFNLIKRVVNTVANRVKLAAITIPGEADSAENLKLNEIRTANEMELYEKLLIRKTLMYGDSYVVVWPVDPEDSYEDEALITAGVSLAYNSPLNTRMIYDPTNERKPLYAIRAWKENDYRRADVYYRDYVERWITVQPKVTGHREAEWQRYTETVLDPISGEQTSDEGIVHHDFGEIPVIHFRTDLSYGKPEAIDGYNPQRAINKALATLNASIEKAGYPARYLLMDAGALDTHDNSSDPLWEGTDTTQVPTPPIKDTPGSIQRINGAKSAGQWSPADPSNFLDPIMAYIRLMALATETPAYELNPSGEQPSGEARRQADKPLESKVADRQAFLRGSFSNLYRLALKASDIQVTTVEVQWAPTSPINDPEGLEVVAAKQNAGVPVGQTLLELGYSQEQVNEWLDNIAEATTLDQKVETIGKIATALKDLGTASALNVISAEQVDDIVNTLFASITGNGE